MKLKKKIVFLSGTRADFGKIKSLIQVLEDQDTLRLRLFVESNLKKKRQSKKIKKGFKNTVETLSKEIQKLNILTLHVTFVRKKNNCLQDTRHFLYPNE